MSCTDSVLFVGLLLGLLGTVFILGCFLADYLWPWLDRVWHARNAQPRPQATYRQRHL